MAFADLKEDAKRSLNPHFGYYLLLFLPFFSLRFVNWILGGTSNSNRDFILQFGWLVLLGQLLLGLVTIGVMFVLIDHGRKLIQDYDSDQALSRALTTFSRADYFWGVLGLGALVFVCTALWSLLLVIPGIIKGFSYSQALYIYRDHLNQGDKIGFNQAITESRQLMDGHKGELFLLKLSFIGWWMLGFFVLPTLWVAPYYYQTMANYYVELSAPETTEKDDDDLMSIAK